MNKSIKKTYRLVLLTSLICCYALQSHSQKSIIFNPSLNHFILEQGVSNPASFSKDSITAMVSYQNQLGILSDLRDLYFNISLPRKGKQVFGVKAYSEQETSLFTKTKLNGFYAYHLPLSDRVVWAMGVQFGAANISFGSTNSTAGGSAWAGDLSVSSTLFWGQTELGIAMHQISNSSLRPIGYEYRLLPYLSSYLSHEFSLNAILSLQSGIEYHAGSDFSIINIDNCLFFDKRYALLIGVKSTRTISFGCLINIASDIREDIYVGFDYNRVLSSTVVGNNTVGIKLIYAPF